MSETVHFKGVLEVVERHDGENLDEQCKRILNNRELPSYYENYQEFLRDEFYKDMTIQNGVVYRVKKTNVDPDGDIFNATLRENGDIEFEVRYYNGACGFDEALEEAIDNIKK